MHPLAALANITMQATITLVANARQRFFVFRSCSNLARHKLYTNVSLHVLLAC
jgi:hypothetical protein